MINSSLYFGLLGKGALLTLSIALLSVVLGMILAVLFAWSMAAKTKIIKNSVEGFCSLIRGVPDLVTLFIVYFGTLMLLRKIAGHYINFPPLVSGVLTLAIAFAAYAGRVIHGAWHAVAKGQAYSVKVLGLTRGQAFYHVLGPQVIYQALPGLNNLWLCLLKDTALVSLLGVHDLMSVGQLAATSTNQPFTFYAWVAVGYLAFTSLSQYLFAKVQLHLQRGQAC